MKLKKNKEIIYGLIILLLYFIGIEIQNKNYVSGLIIATIILGIQKILISSFEIKIFIIFIIQYLYCFLEYFILNKTLSVYVQYNNFKYIYSTAMLTFLFTAILFSFLESKREEKFVLLKKNNVILAIINFSILIYFLLTGVNGEIGIYQKIKLSSKIEYSLIPYILLNYVATKKQLKIINIVYGFFAIYMFLIGSRITGIQIIFSILFYLRPSFLFPKFISQKKIRYFKENVSLLLAFVGILLMKFIEKTRNIEGLLFERINTLLKLSSKNIIINNEADVIYSGTAMLALVKIGILDISDSLKSWLGFIFNIFFIPYYDFMANLPVLVSKYTKIGGGGLISSFLYYLGREPLVILGAYFIATLINRRYKNNSLTQIYSAILIITVFRWYSYSLANLYKLSFYALVWYIFNLKIDYILKYNIKKINKKFEN